MKIRRAMMQEKLANSHETWFEIEKQSTSLKVR